MPNNLVPKVKITEAVASLQVPRQNLVVIGIIGTSEMGTANTIFEVKSVAQADVIFGSNYSKGANLVPMIRRAFQEGASVIKAASVGLPTLPALSSSVLTADSVVGDDTLAVTDGTVFSAGDIVFIGTGSTYQYEERREVLSQTALTVVFTEPLTFKHYIGETVQVITEKVSADYTTAITAMKEDEDKGLVICELNDDTTASALETMCEDSTDLYNTPCVYVRAPELDDDEASVIANAQAHNSSRVICLYPLLTDFNGKTVTSGEVSAAFAGVISGNGVPKLNHNFSDFTGFGGVKSKISDMDSLISAGVTPIELKYNSIHVVRFVTTSTIKNGVPDLSRQEGAVRLNVDFMEKAISRVLQQKFLQQGNTAQVRLSMKAEVTAMLTKYTSLDILVPDEDTNTPAFREPVVSTDPDDSTKVNVDVEVAPGKPLNFINLNFKVYL